ncbi:hypothetical protein EV421DRAFT_1821569 [Armillaria borealis]|uniref:DUF6699 domain-containing protein n=1 Tax=Armillaria borealis TaxID=47425 RepID=A0AA39JEK5_9AGAR|nr:hypothetical protein EV421DRAFT_1821569 [Armillaria borealis]
MHPLLAGNNAPISYDVTFPPSSRSVVDRNTRSAFPWPVVFYLGNAPTIPTEAQPISNMDLLYALHNTLAVSVTHEEWNALSNGSPMQRKVTRAYQRRCSKMGVGWEGGVRRIDWLGQEVQLIGIEVDKNASAGGIAKLIFGRPSTSEDGS